MQHRRQRLQLTFGSTLFGCICVGVAHLTSTPLSLPASLLFCLGLGLVSWIVTRPTFFRQHVGAATPETLGAIRVITCAILLVMVLWIEDVPSSALLPAEMRHLAGPSVSIMQLFYAIPGFEAFIGSQVSLQLFEGVTLLTLSLGLVGWRTRITLPLSAFCYFLLGGIMRHYDHLYHTGLMPFYVLIVLAFTPCSDGLSVDRQLKIRRGQPVPIIDHPSALYGWSRYLCWVVIALSYVAAGLSKLRQGGLLWWTPVNMRHKLYGTALDPMQFDWGLSVHLSHAPDLVFALLGLMGLLGELAFGLVLFLKWSRWVIPPAMAMIHLGIFFLQNILFLDLLFLPLVFFDFTIIRRYLGGGMNAPPHNKLFVDQASPLKSTFKQARLTTMIIVLFLTCWLVKIEYYPLTSWGMFSGKDTSGVITYTKLLAHYENGVITRAYPEYIIPALFDARYRKVLQGCISTKEKRINACEKFLKKTGSVHNQTAAPGKHIVGFELQTWRWDFKTDPDHSDQGILVGRHLTSVN